MNKFFRFLYVVALNVLTAPILMVSAIWDTIATIANKGSAKECWKGMGRAASSMCENMCDFVNND